MNKIGIIVGTSIALNIAITHPSLAGYYGQQKTEEKNNRDIEVAVGTLAYAENKLRIEQRRLLRWQNRLKRFGRELENLEDRNDAISRRQGRIIVERLDAGEENRQAQLRLSRERVSLRVEQIKNRRRIAELKLLIATAKRKIKTHSFWVEYWKRDVRDAKKRLIRLDRR